MDTGRRRVHRVTVASLGHIAVGMAAGRWWGGRHQRSIRAAMVGACVLSFLPDLDVVAFALGIPYEHEWGHRGASHSFAFAALLALPVAVLLRRQAPVWLTSALVFAVVGSHGLLDTLTDGGLGIALWWPLSLERFFAPWRPIPVSPIGPAFVSARGLYVMGVELLMFTPLWLYALWPRGRDRAPSG